MGKEAELVSPRAGEREAGSLASMASSYCSFLGAANCKANAKTIGPGFFCFCSFGFSSTF